MRDAFGQLARVIGFAICVTVAVVSMAALISRDVRSQFEHEIRRLIEQPGSASAAPPSPSPAVAVPAVSVARPTVASPATPEPSANNGSNGADAPERARVDFASPSGNIICTLTRQAGVGVVWCGVESVGRLVAFAANGHELIETGKYEIRGDYETLAYGDEVSANGLTCASSERGVRCTRRGKGFLVNREGIHPVGGLRVLDSTLTAPWRTTLGTFIAIANGGGGGGGGGSVVVCRDGWISHSGGSQGACSWHGGVR